MYGPEKPQKCCRSVWSDSVCRPNQGRRTALRRSCPSAGEGRETASEAGSRPLGCKEEAGCAHARTHIPTQSTNTKRARARAHAHTHTRTHARTVTHAYKHTHTHAPGDGKPVPSAQGDGAPAEYPGIQGGIGEGGVRPAHCQSALAAAAASERGREPFPRALACIRQSLCLAAARATPPCGRTEGVLSGFLFSMFKRPC